jgi:hypothetical protein
VSERGVVDVRAQNVVVDEAGPFISAGKYVRILIRDNGCGIPEAILPKIFDPYFTTKETGSGLGLATAYSIVTKHHGHISADSTVGQGTTFYIHLPASEMSPVTQPATVIRTGTGLPRPKATRTGASMNVWRSVLKCRSAGKNIRVSNDRFACMSWTSANPSSGYSRREQSQAEQLLICIPLNSCLWAGPQSENARPEVWITALGYMCRVVQRQIFDSRQNEKFHRRWPVSAHRPLGKRSASH